jgi:hypothetical protein
MPWIEEEGHIAQWSNAKQTKRQTRVENTLYRKIMNTNYID